MTQSRKLSFYVMVLVLISLACRLLQTPVATLAPSSVPTLMSKLEPDSTPSPTHTLAPTPESTTTATPTSPPPEKWAGPFRSVTSLANLKMDSLDDAQVHALGDGSVWVITGQSIMRWKEQTWDFKFPKSDDMLATVDDGGRLWVLPPEMSEIRVWQDGKWKSYGADSGWTKASISEIGLWWAPMPWGVSVAMNGTLWLPTDRDVRFFDGDRWTLYTLEDMGYPPQDSEDIGIVHNLAVKEYGAEVWVGECYYSGPGPMGGNGVRWFDGETWHGEDAPVGPGCVSVIKVDDEDNVWLTDMDVVWRYKPAGQAWTSYSLPGDLLGDFNFALPLQLVVDGIGDVWVMMEMCGGASCSGPVNLYRIHGDEWSLIIESQDWTLTRKQVVIDGSGQGWVFWDGTVYRLQGESMESVASIMIRSVDVSPDGKVWVLDENQEDPTLWILEPE